MVHLPRPGWRNLLQGNDAAYYTVMGGTGIALLSQSTLIHRLQMDIMLPGPGLEESSSGQSHNLLNN